MRLRSCVLAVALVLLTACGDGDDGGLPQARETTGTPAPVTTSPTAPDNAVTITGADYGYTVTGAPKQGLTRITFQNTGAEVHLAGLLRLNPGKTLTDALTGLRSEENDGDTEVFESPHSFADGSPGLLTPGARTTTYAELAAGKYAIVCTLGTEDDGEPHWSKGMVSELSVDAAGSALAEPAAAGRIVAGDKALTVPPIPSGKAVYEFANDGESDHNVLFVKLHEGATYRSFLAWADKYFAREARLAQRPGDLWGGILRAGPGETVWVELDLPPGDYLALDTETNPHSETKRVEFHRDENGGLRAAFSVT